MRMKRLRNKRAQAILEYILLLLIVVATILVLLTTLRVWMGRAIVYLAGSMDALVPLGPPPPVVDIDFGVHHIGDGLFGGSVNSGFTQGFEGTSWEQSFTINGDPSLSNSVRIQLNATGVQCNNRVYINGVLVGILNSNGRVTISVDPSLLRPGNNTIRIESINETGRYGDYDDFEVSNIQILFN